MSFGPITAATTAIVQPDPSNTKKGQKRLRLSGDYDAIQLNSQLDYIHERLNQIVREDPALADLAGSATLAQVITRLNTITETLRSAGLLLTE